MTVTIENSQLTAKIAEQGAELISLKSKETGIEYIWQGDPAFWARHAPILFPIVGRLKDDQYTYKGRSYSMSQHGFARDQLFTVVEASESSVRLQLLSNEETKQNYPFDFALILTYELTGDGIRVYYQVENTGSDSLYFSIGGHPAFNVPMEPQLTFEDYYLTFSPQKSRLKLPLSGPYVDYAKRTIGQTNTAINLDRELFSEDALVYETKGLNSFIIASDDSDHSIRLTYENMPYVGFWSPYPKQAPFVCIEPWCGIADTVDATGELTEKLGMNQLEQSEKFLTSYTITVK